MNPLYAAALNGTLKANPDPNKRYAPQLTIKSALSFSVCVYSLSTTGRRVGWQGNYNEKGGNLPFDMPPGGSFMSTGLYVGDILLITCAYSGGFFAVVELTDPSQTVVTFTPDLICSPNDIGSVPQPTQAVIIPPDSPRVVVGSGTIAGGNSVVREQYWKRMPESYSLAPKSTQQVSYTVTTGMESTTSQQDTIAAALGLSASAGWGPISASVSASLSTTSTTFQQQTYSTQSTSFTSTELTNTTDDPEILFVWQLTDVVTIFDQKQVPIGSVITGGEPEVIDGPYVPTQLVEKLPLVTAHELRRSSNGQHHGQALTRTAG